MGDAGEGLIDAESRIQERMEDLERERVREKTRGRDVRDPARVAALESLRLARTELDRQRMATAHEGRRAQLQQAMDEIDRRMAEVSAHIA